MWPIQCATYPLAAPNNRFAQNILFQFYWHAQIFPAKFYLTHTIRFMEQLNTIPPGLDLITCNLKENLDRPPFPFVTRWNGFYDSGFVFKIRIYSWRRKFWSTAAGEDRQADEDKCERGPRPQILQIPAILNPRYCGPRYCRPQILQTLNIARSKCCRPQI